MPRHFWVLSDGKTVREISEEKMRELHKRNYRSTEHTYQLVTLYDNEIIISKGKNYIYMKLKQLKEILGDDV